MIRTRKALLGLLVFLAAGVANAESYGSVKALMMSALNSPDGVASGIVEGKEADKIHETTGSSDPLRGEVSTVWRYKEEGCSRLAVKLIQPNTPTKEGPKTDFTLNYELNICKDGMPPSSTAH
ncbi:MAG: hypothetical protein GW936_09895 [Gallionella sp.]|nr:hypothetical protein [Gallionella sp.]